MMEESKAKVYDFIKGNLMNLVIVLISLAYIFYNMVIIERTDLTLEECIVRAGFGTIVGLLIKQGIGENGFSKAYNSEIWKNKLNDYSKCCNMANPYLDLVDNFYEAETKERRYQIRKNSMINARMRYDWFFDEEGNYIDNADRYSKLTRYQKRVLKKCVRLKVYNLNLFSEYANEYENTSKPERTDRWQRTRMLGKNSFVQVFGAIAGVYFIATWNAWNWGAFITATLQVISWTVCGIIEMYDNYNYVAVDKVNKLTRKMELIVKFTRGCEKGLYRNEDMETDTISNI